jgi:hypothetical protein
LPSDALGVLHIRLRLRVRSLSLSPSATRTAIESSEPCPSSPNPCGVGHICTASESDGELFLFRAVLRLVLIEPLSIARGVGQKPPFSSGPSSSLGRPIADDEHAVSYVRGTKRGRWKTLPFRIEPEGGQIPENVAHSSSKEPWDVLHEDVSGSKYANDAGELGPEPAFVGLGKLLPGLADGLTGEAAADEIDGFDISEDVADVADAVDVGPVLTEDRPTVGV